MNRIPGPDSALDWRINMFHFSEVRSHFSKHYLNSMVRSRLGKSHKPSSVFAFGPDLNRQILSNPNFSR